MGSTVNRDGAEKSPEPRDLPVAFQRVMALPAARERVLANASIVMAPKKAPSLEICPWRFNGL
jgi:hypothetical protein